MVKSKTKGNKLQKRNGGSFWRSLVRVCMLLLSICVAIALTVCSYSGLVSPLRHGGYWGILALAMPTVLAISLFLAILQLFFYRRGSAILLCALILCSGPILTLCPLHFTKRTPHEGASTFSLLSYNVANIVDQRPEGEFDPSYSAIISYVINSDADIVCLSEATHFTPTERNRMTAAQLDSLHSIYPYIISTDQAQVTLSRFPMEAIHLNFPSDVTNGKAFVGAYRVSLPDGKLITLFNVHLQSIGLQNDDKELYLGLTDLQPTEYSDIKEQLLSKLAVANVKRANQTQMLLQAIRHYGGPDVIICGDFNDVPDSYPIRCFEDAGFRSVYPDIGFGPIVTFNADRFYFCIDHILYRGALRPISISKGSTKASDHYPLTTIFEVE